jgi:hypothetical protein
VLDMDSSVSPTHGEQENSVWNGHYACTCYHPLCWPISSPVRQREASRACQSVVDTRRSGDQTLVNIALAPTFPARPISHEHFVTRQVRHRVSFGRVQVRVTKADKAWVVASP